MSRARPNPARKDAAGPLPLSGPAKGAQRVEGGSQPETSRGTFERGGPANLPSEAGGAPASGPAFLAVGKLRRSHGVHGEILMEVYTDFPERLQPGIILFAGDEAQPLTLMKTRQHREGLLMTFAGYTTPEEVSQLRNEVLYVRSADRPPLEEGEYYHHQLLGLPVVTGEGETLGTVIEILETGASDILVVRQEMGADILIPIVDDFVRQIDLPGRRITVQLIPGMRSEEA